jgi:hypothetical protein
MNKVIVDEELRAKLNGSITNVELCDPSGRVVAYIVSPDEYLSLRYVKARERYTDAEIEELRKQSGGRPLADVLRDLGAA